MKGVRRGIRIGEVAPPSSVMVWLGVVSAVDWVESRLCEVLSGILN